MQPLSPISKDQVKFFISLTALPARKWNFFYSLIGILMFLSVQIVAMEALRIDESPLLGREEMEEIPSSAAAPATFAVSIGSPTAYRKTTAQTKEIKYEAAKKALQMWIENNGEYTTYPLSAYVMRGSYKKNIQYVKEGRLDLLCPEKKSGAVKTL